MSISLLNKALEYSQLTLGQYTRLSGEAVYEHACRVYTILRNNNVQDEVTLSAALIHPILEYVKEPKELRELFGEEVYNLVRNYNFLSNSNIDKNTPNAFNEAFIIQAYINMAKDIRTLVIRIADRKDNLDTVFILEKEKRIEVANKAMYLYAPLAKLSGFSKLSLEMEDTAFKILYPSEYYKIESDLSENSEKYQSKLSEVIDLLKVLFSEAGIHPTISHRVKSKYGIYKKSQRDEVRDILGIRILVDTVGECYSVEALIKGLFETYADLRDDYISKPRPSGYQSIHNTVKVDTTTDIEVQIRTREMHQYNEFGPASHLIYKIADKGSTSLAYQKFKKYTQENQLWFKELSYWEARNQPDSNYKHAAPFSNNVYAFTPKGDIIELPKGACLVDFAYALHSDIGDKCVGGHVNRKYISLNYLVQDGDYIEVKTTNKVNANRDWLKFVKTKKAKEYIRRKLMRNLAEKK